MSTTFYTSDWHLFHNNILNLTNRPFQNVEEMHQVLIDNYKRKVEPKDEVYFLGDIGMYHSKEIANIIRKLPGRKHLITGNHDYQNLNDKSLRSCFASIHTYDVITDKGRKVVLFHYPIEEWDGFYRGFYHIHGHVHDKSYQITSINKRYNASVDECSFEPLTLDEFIERED